MGLVLGVKAYVLIAGLAVSLMGRYSFSTAGEKLSSSRNIWNLRPWSFGEQPLVFGKLPSP